MRNQNRTGRVSSFIAIIFSLFTCYTSALFGKGPVIVQPKAKVSGLPAGCTESVALGQQEALSIGFAAAEKVNGCLLDTAEYTPMVEDEAGPEVGEKICTTALVGISRAMGKIEGTGMLHTDTIHAIRSANEEIKKNKSTRNYQTRLEHLQKVQKLSPQQVERIARQGRLGYQLGAIKFFKWTKFFTSLNFLMPASGVSAAVLGMAPTVAKSYEDALCSETSLIPTKVVDGKCEIDYKMTEELADFIITGDDFKKRVEGNPHLCEYLDRLAKETYRGLSYVLPNNDEYGEMQLSSDSAFCFNGSRNYAVDFKSQAGEKSSLTFFRGPDLFTVKAAPGHPYFETIEVPIVDGALGNSITVKKSGAATFIVDASRAPDGLRDRQIANVVTTSNLADRFFFGPFVKRCCNESKQDIRSISGCPPIGLQSLPDSPVDDAVKVKR